MLYLNNGYIKVKTEIGYKKQELINREWIEESFFNHKITNNYDLIDGYGYQIWNLSNNTHVFNGMFGQNVYICPKENLLIATIAGGEEVLPNGKITKYVTDFIKNITNSGISSMPIWPVKYDYYNNNLYYMYLTLIKRNRNNIKEYDDILKKLLNNCYYFEEYASSILPITMQVIYSIYLTGITEIRFSLINKCYHLEIKDSGVQYYLPLSFKKFTYTILDIMGKIMPVAIDSSIVLDEDNNFVLKIKIIYLEEVSTRVFKIFLLKDMIRIEGSELPVLGNVYKNSSFNNAINIDKSKFKVPEYLNYKVIQMMNASAKGQLKERL